MSQMEEDSLKQGGDTSQDVNSPHNPRGFVLLLSSCFMGGEEKGVKGGIKLGSLFTPTSCLGEGGLKALCTVARPPSSGCPHPARPLHVLFLQPGPSFP